MPEQYRLPYTLRAPSEETEDMYLAEVPVLPGCRAWGATAEEALLNLEGVAADYIASCEEHGDPLPAAIAAAGELVVAV
ncbi:MAG: type II toxin-antitoxin system HicB family antitoxin [Chloroflexi bacterium]|nr:type II toxin-antitoxin system HicB family antitoxin [Chloroflexota bacterium]